MKTKTNFKKILYIIAALLLSLFCCFESALSVKANAETTTEYSDVLTDLQKDVNFDASTYAADDTDNSLSVIQIAESSNGELFVYVYQPSNAARDLIATKISLSTVWGGCKDFKVYDLELLSSSGVFDKYRVADLEVAKTVMRYYHINSIYRAFDEDIDTAPTDDNQTGHIAFGVGQLWTATTVNGTVSYAVEIVEQITVTSKHVGFIRYLDAGLWIWAKDMTDSHYIAFSTDHPIDNLLEAEVVYSYESFYEYDRSPDSDLSTFFKNQDYKNRTGYGIDITKTLYRYEDGVDVNNCFFYDDYKYNRIQSIAEFISGESEKMTAETELALKEKQWVLRFLETEYDYYAGYVSDTYFPYSYTTREWTEVTDVGILRLRFIHDGQIYDMGVIDNLSQGDESPDNENPYEPEYPDWLDKLLDLIISSILMVGVSLLLSFIPGIGAVFGLVFGALMKVVGWALKGVFWLIAFPFNLIGKLFKRKKEK